MKGRVQKVNILNIMYIEALQHDLIYHMDKDGVTYTVRGIIKDLEATLKDYYFFRCHKRVSGESGLCGKRRRGNGADRRRADPGGETTQEGIAE